MILKSPPVAYDPASGVPVYMSPNGSTTFYPTYDQWQDVPDNVMYFRYFPPGYAPAEPLTLWAGTITFDDKQTFYKVDPQGFLAFKYNMDLGEWEDGTIKRFVTPTKFHVATEADNFIDKKELAKALMDTGMFVAKTRYIEIGDEPKGGSGALNLKSMLLPDEVANIKKFLTFMPRSMLRDWFMKEVWPSIPANFSDSYGLKQGTKKQFEDLVWAAFIEIFNEANLEHVTREKKDPWDWEEEKVEAYYISQNEPALKELEGQISEYQGLALAFDPQAQAIMEQYAMLPKVGDLGLEINRQNAVKELLRQKDYASAQAIVDAFRYAADTVIGPAIENPIPFDIVAADGSAVVRRTEQGTGNR